MGSKQIALGLDIGERRIGVATGDSIARIAMPATTVVVDGRQTEHLQKLISEHQADLLVVGLPRNQAGEETAQSRVVREVVREQLESLGLPIVFQDESVTSVLAEQELSNRKKPFTKADIDAQAAAILLQDYLDAWHA